MSTSVLFGFRRSERLQAVEGSSEAQEVSFFFFFIVVVVVVVVVGGLACARATLVNRPGLVVAEGSWEGSWENSMRPCRPQACSVGTVCFLSEGQWNG